MNTLTINVFQGLGQSLWGMYFYTTSPTYLSFLNGLDYVTRVSSRYNTYTLLQEQVLFFETEQDKMFFLLKYS